MTKKHFIDLADHIRAHNARTKQFGKPVPFTRDHLETLAAFCASHNPGFKEDRWLAYLAGQCGPNGGQLRQPRRVLPLP